MKSISLLLVLVSCSFASGASIQGIPFTDVQTTANAVSADGSTVVGGGPNGAFKWSQAGGYSLLPKAAGATWWARGVSGDGTYVVGWRVKYNTRTNTAQTLAQPSDYLTGGAFGVSADGSTVVGAAETGMAGNPTGAEAAYWDADGVPHLLGHLPASGSPLTGAANAVSGDGRVIVGFSGAGIEPEDQPRAFRWTAQTGMVDMGRLRPTDTSATATAISYDGSVIVGISQVDRISAQSAGWIWTAQNGMQALGDLPGGMESSAPHGVSADGSIIVGRSESSEGAEAFIWDATHGMRSLESALTNDYNMNLGGWRLYDVVGISGDGTTLIGTGRDPSGNYRSWVVTVPEPSVLLLVLAGVGMFKSRRFSGKTR